MLTNIQLKISLNTIACFLIVPIRFLKFFIGNNEFEFGHAFLEFPIGVQNSTNSLKWKANNFLFARISIGDKVHFTTRNEFRFINKIENKNVSITLVGRKNRLSKDFRLELINVTKKNAPEVSFQRKFNQTKSTEIFKKVRPVKVFSEFIVALKQTKIANGNVDMVKNNTILLPPKNEKLFEQLESVSKSNNNQLLNQLKDEGIVLPKSQARPYYEVAMESRWLR